MALLTIPMLIVVCGFVFLRTGDMYLHWLHKLVFSRLTFYHWPSDETVRRLLPRGGPLASVASTLPSKVRKRLAKRAGVDPSVLSPAAHANDGAPVELTVASISDSLFVGLQSDRFEQFRFYVGVHIALLALVFVEQGWICWHSDAASVSTDAAAAATSSTATAAAEGAHVTSSTVVILCAGLLFNLWVGLGILARAQNAIVAGTSGSTVRFIFRSSLVLGAGALAFTLFLQSLSPTVSLTSLFFTNADGPLYARYLNALGMFLLRSVHDAVTKAQVAGSSASATATPYDLLKYLPALPSSADDLHLEHWLSFHAFKTLLAVLAACMSTSFFCSAWRYANLLHDKLEDNADALAEGAAAAASAVPGTAAAKAAAAGSGASTGSSGEEDDASDQLSTRARLRLYLSSLAHVLNFLSPLFIVALWLPPVSSSLWLAVFAQQRAGVDGVTEQEAAASMLRAWQSFEVFRVACVWACLLLRIVLLRSYLQVWLLSAMSAIRRMPAATAPTAEQHAAVRMQAILKAVFAFTPFVALQLLYPVGVSMMLLAAWKLAGEWAPPGAGALISDASWARGGWGVCYALVGKGCSPLDVQHVLKGLSATLAPTTTAATDAASIVAAAQAQPSRLSTAPLDADEFDGDLSALDVDEAAPAAAGAGASVGVDAGATSSSDAASSFGAASFGSSSSSSLVSSSSSFVPPSRANVLATALGFLLVWSFVAWFVSTLLCFLWIKSGASSASAAAGTAAGKAITHVEVEHNVPVDGSNKKATPAGASGLRERRSGPPA
jgi:hypothetical protein